VRRLHLTDAIFPATPASCFASYSSFTFVEPWGAGALFTFVIGIFAIYITQETDCFSLPDNRPSRSRLAALDTLFHGENGFNLNVDVDAGQG
jgi:hypothetical protein